MNYIITNESLANCCKISIENNQISVETKIPSGLDCHAYSIEIDKLGLPEKVKQLFLAQNSIDGTLPQLEHKENIEMSGITLDFQEILNLLISKISTGEIVVNEGDVDNISSLETLLTILDSNNLILHVQHTQ